MTPVPPRPSPRIALGRIALALPLAYAAWSLLREGNAVAHTIAWACGADGCSTDDPKVFLFFGGAAATVAFFLVLISVLRLVAFGAALALAPLAAIQGWQDAIDSGLPASEVATEFKVWGAVAGAGLLLAFAGLVYELRATATLESLIGRERVPAHLVDYQEGAKPGIGSGTLVFRDKSGHRHRRRFPAVPQSWTRRALLAVYPPHDPTRARIALTWYRPFNAAAARAALAERTFEDSGAPEASVIGELERLAALRREGLLSEEEFQRAKRRHLGT
ncbi:SHOCT domain-containing protein [Glycomyces sp. NRRL B-16210]|uniref:SHOCT domain-containing protein n=1 Tax=Glycomyces sp. NRRL B-16210 TaxID=1463821 RepID=UPI0004C218C1|nr:SHOCT domain-containing protein [Glycomyces sp. NRRL B-16210]